MACHHHLKTVRNRETPRKWTASETKYIAEHWGKKTPDQMAEYLGRTRLSILSRARTVHGLRLTGPKSKKRHDFKPRRAEGVEGFAARHLQTLGPCYRCDELGRSHLEGKFWRFGNGIYTDDELIARAERAGWKQEIWSPPA